MLTALPQEELKEQLATMTGMDIEIRMKQYVTKGYNQPPTLFHQRYNLPQTAHP
ncbi:MAG: hypothetical protein HOD01_02450 [Oceanospirillaceae bacterium]|nr:hypothetical protein [Oceanospirillaceae bacterium]